MQSTFGQAHHLPHRLHVAAAHAATAQPGWLAIVIVAVAIFSVGLWWVTRRS